MKAAAPRCCCCYLNETGLRQKVIILSTVPSLQAFIALQISPSTADIPQPDGIMSEVSSAITTAWGGLPSFFGTSSHSIEPPSAPAAQLAGQGGGALYPITALNLPVNPFDQGDAVGGASADRISLYLAATEAAVRDGPPAPPVSTRCPPAFQQPDEQDGSGASLNMLVPPAATAAAADRLLCELTAMMTITDADDDEQQLGRNYDDDLGQQIGNFPLPPPQPHRRPSVTQDLDLDAPYPGVDGLDITAPPFNPSSASSSSTTATITTGGSSTASQGCILDGRLSSPIKLALVGNPGSGKSTIQNGLAGVAAFRSGVSFGSGLTFQFDSHRTAGGHLLYDTPGLSDNKKRAQAALAIQEMLKQGGDYKLIFVITQKAGRAIDDDVTTMKLVLEAASDVGCNYGVIINQVHPKIKQRFEDDPEAMINFGAATLCTLPREVRTNHITIMLEDADLLGEEDKVKPLPEDILQFILDTPTIKQLDPDSIKKIRSEAFAEANEETSRLRLEYEQVLKENEKMKKEKETLEGEKERLMVEKRKAYGAGKHKTIAEKDREYKMLSEKKDRENRILNEQKDKELKELKDKEQQMKNIIENQGRALLEKEKKLRDYEAGGRNRLIRAELEKEAERLRASKSSYRCSIM